MYNNFKLLIMIKIVTKNTFTPKVVLNHIDTDINHKTCIQKKNHIQILTFGQRKNVRYKKQQS
jgi:hypothetical protein